MQNKHRVCRKINRKGYIRAKAEYRKRQVENHGDKTAVSADLLEHNDRFVLIDIIKAVLANYCKNRVRY